MNVDAFVPQLVELLLVIAVCAGVVLYVKRQPARFARSPEDDMRQTIADLSATVNTLRRQLDEADRNIRLLQEENARLKARVSELEGQMHPAKPPVAESDPWPPKWLLAVSGGEDRFFDRDRASLNRAHVPFHRLRRATRRAMQEELRRRRQDDTLYPCILVSAHAGPEGVLLIDGIVGPDFWREHLTGVTFVLLAACEGSTTADELAGLVERVVWFSEEVPNQAAADFVYAFFRRLVEKAAVDTPTEEDFDRAYADALREVPAVAEYVDIRRS